MTARHCEHVKANGHFCGSPALRGRNYCYFHMVHIGRQLRQQSCAARGLPASAMELPLLEDAASLQLALMQVTEALLRGSLDHKTAGLVLYSLQTAAINLRTMREEAEADTGSAVCNRYDSFEQDYELEEDAAAGLRVEERAEDGIENDCGVDIANSASVALPPARWEVVGAGEQPAAGGSAAEGNSQPPASRRPRPIKLTDEEFQLPWSLTHEQYLQAEVAIFQYRLDHNIDANDRAAKVVPQRPAISQKIALGAKKPVRSVGEERQQLAISN